MPIKVEIFAENRIIESILELGDKAMVFPVVDRNDSLLFVCVAKCNQENTVISRMTTGAIFRFKSGLIVVAALEEGLEKIDTLFKDELCEFSTIRNGGRATIKITHQ